MDILRDAEDLQRRIERVRRAVEVACLVANFS